MELIFLTRGRRVQRAVHLRGAAMALVVVLLGAVAGGAYLLGARNGVAPVADPRADLLAAAMRRALSEREEEVRKAVGEAQYNLDALALRLSELQARAIRLDALGGRLVTLAGLDADEFSFGKPPARGGPAPADGGEPNRVPDFVAALERLEADLASRGQELAALETSLLSGRLAEQTRPQGRPLETGWISSSFGWRSDPISGQRAHHQGVDLAGRRGSPIQAVAAGIVIFSGTRAGYGRMVEIDHGNGYVTRYGHNLKNLVKVGQRVAKGDVIAQLGSTGRSTGYHVHFEVLHDGKPLNPMKFIRSARAEGGS